MFNEYFKQLKEIINTESYTEHTLKPPFENLLNSVKTNTNIHIKHEPKSKKGLGRPDFEIFKNGALIGYIETKHYDGELEKYLDTEKQQLEKYLEFTDNLIFTNYREFILYRKKEPVKRLTLFYKTDKKLSKDNISKLKELFVDFFTFSVTPISNPKNLSELLAIRTKRLREYLKDLLNSNEKSEFKDRIMGEGGLYEVFKKILIKDLTLDDFVDTYSQTLTYGLFLSRLNPNYNSTLNTDKIVDKIFAYNSIPKSLGVIRNLFETLKIQDIPNHINWIVDEIIRILNNIETLILSKELSFSKEIDYEDPYVYFYEHFLATYDKTKRKAKGVYYTPIPVVHFIINSIDTLLKKHFNTDFRDKNVVALDFATGTGTFLLETFKKALENVDKGQVKSFIKEHLLKNFYGFEYLVAPYTIAHLKLSQFLEEKGYILSEEERLQIYLTDTLDNAEHEHYALFPRLSKESEEANKIKLEKPILVVMGNPPYNIRASNLTKEAKELVEKYKYVDGKRIKEKGALQFEKNLQDDYVKFIAFAQKKIEEKGEGIIGIITNHNYLDGITLRGMRYSLLKTFNQIYILDLHGNSKKKEKCPDGSKDENVFDIQQGVSITMFIKKDGLEKHIYRYDLYGLRKSKYEWLLNNDLTTIKWTKIKPQVKFYFFNRLNYKLKKEYDKFNQVTKIFNIHGTGIITAHDNFVIDFEKKKLLEKFKRFKKSERNENLLHKKFKVKKKGGWSILKAWKRFQDIDINDFENYIKEIDYRLFDKRYIFYEDTIIWTPVHKVVDNFYLEETNFCLITSKLTKGEVFKHVLISNKMIEVIFLSSKTSNNAYTFPLYIFSESNKLENKQTSLGIQTQTEKKSNFTKDFTQYINSLYKSYKPRPEEILAYIYAVLYSSTYRERYYEFLKTDFPRIPFTKDKNLFTTLSNMGTKLINHHLLKERYSDSQVRYCGEGDNKVEKVSYGNNQVKINKINYFDNVPKEIWAFEIGGYKVLDKYLKSRKGRELTYEEQEHFKKVVSVLKETINIMNDIDIEFKKVIKEIQD